MKKILFILGIFSFIILSGFSVIKSFTKEEVKKKVVVYASESAEVFNQNAAPYYGKYKGTGHHCISNILGDKQGKIGGYDFEKYNWPGPDNHDMSLRDSLRSIMAKDRNIADSIANKFIFYVLKSAFKTSKKDMDEYLDVAISVWDTTLTEDGKKNAKAMFKFYSDRIDYILNLSEFQQKKLFEGGKKWIDNKVWFLQSLARIGQLETTNADSVPYWLTDDYGKPENQKAIKEYNYFHQTMTRGGFGWKHYEEPDGCIRFGVSRSCKHTDWLTTSIRWCEYISNPLAMIYDGGRNGRKPQYYKNAKFEDWLKGLKLANYSLKYFIKNV